MRIKKWPVIVLPLAMLISVCLLPVELWLVKSLVDLMQAWTVTASISPLIESAAGLAVLMIFTHIIIGVPVPMAMTRLMENGTLEQQRMLLHKTSMLPLAAVEAPAIKNLRERAMRISLYDIYHSNLTLLQNAFSALILILIMLAFNQWIPVAAVCAAALLHAAASGKAAGSLAQLSRDQAPLQRLCRHYSDLMTNREAAKEIRLFRIGGLLSSRWADAYEQQSQEKWQAVRTSELRKFGPALVIRLSGGILIALLVLLPGATRLSAGDFALLLLLIPMLLSRLTEIGGLASSIRKHYMHWEDFSAYLNLSEDSRIQQWEASDQRSVHAYTVLTAGLAKDEAPGVDNDKGDARTVPSNSIPTRMESLSFNMESLPFNNEGFQLQVRDLAFTYSGANHRTINGLSFTIPPGCRAALVGENGSGKSTLIKLLLGLYEPDRGEICWISGQHFVRGKPPKGAVSVVFQDFSRWSLTLRENVALGQIDKQDQDLQRALRQCGSRFQQLDMQLGAAFGGIEPSGGEWQQIVTARAMVRGAPFVFFDEPTAALDPQAEKEVFELFLRATDDRSALLVTHRLGAARLADLVLVLKDGHLVEQGSHEQLMAIEGEYRRMFLLQQSWYV